MSKQYIYEVDGVNTGFIPGVGAIVDGKIESDVELEGVQYKLVSGTASQPAPVVGTTSQANPAQPATLETKTDTGATQ